ncbi:hypothetical protein BU15DRAFT_38523 [Melanogaster broomeanus]|nr:hypothetical protein BU15DRAFT_38523 [Melanogaster broomeanus]
MALSAQCKEDELRILCTSAPHLPGTNVLVVRPPPALSLVRASISRTQDCTGERNKAQYVPMNAYGWGTMMRDYCYLEEVGRSVGEWGKEIVRGGYAMENNSRGKVVRGRGRPSNGRRKTTTGWSKRDILRAHLEMLDIDVELLANGMERRKLNQSTFDQKSKRPHLTIEFTFHPPATSASTSSPPAPTHTILSHRNQLSTTLIAALQRHAPWTASKPQKQKETALPHWVPGLVNPHPDDPEGFVPPHCYIRTRVDFLHSIHTGAAPVHPNAVYYHKLDPTLNLAELLRHTHFVEFPTIHVFDPDASSFSGTVLDKAGSIARLSEDEQGGERAAKRRRLNKKVGMEAIAGLVGEYGSESGSQSEAETENKQRSGLATLGEYSGSDDDEHTQRDTEARRMQDGCQEMSDDESSSDGEDAPVDPAVLLELVKQARGAADEDLVDWGDEWDQE